MRTALVCAVLMALSLDSMAQGAPAAQVEVRFDHPEKFRDASLDSHGYERGADAYVMKSLTQYLQKLGQRYLQPGQQLVIDIRDIDLAGRFEPWHSRAYDVRFMREITWPTIDLSYTLNQPGKPAQHAQERKQVDYAGNQQRAGYDQGRELHGGGSIGQTCEQAR